MHFNIFSPPGGSWEHPKLITNASGNDAANMIGQDDDSSAIFSKMTAQSPPKCHPKSIKNRPWIAQGDPWTSKGWPKLPWIIKMVAQGTKM